MKRDFTFAISKVTRTADKSARAIKTATLTDVSLNVLRRFKVATQDDFGEFAIISADHVNNPAMCADEELLDKGYASHSEYVENAREAIEVLDVMIDQLCSGLGIALGSPQSSSLRPTLSKTVRRGSPSFGTARRGVDTRRIIENKPRPTLPWNNEPMGVLSKRAEVSRRRAMSFLR